MVVQNHLRQDWGRGWEIIFVSDPISVEIDLSLYRGYVRGFDN